MTVTMMCNMLYYFRHLI